MSLCLSGFGQCLSTVAVQYFVALSFRCLVGCSSSPLALADSDLQPEESGVASGIVPAYADCRDALSSHSIKDGLGLDAGHPILRSMGLVRRVHPVLTVPRLVLLKSPLHAWGR